MRYEDFAGQSALIENLAEDFRSGQFVHAYLFSGPKGVGKRSCALVCIQTLFCTQKTSERPCGQCEGCQRTLHGNHPDVHGVSGENSIGVDQIRELNEAVQVRAFGGGTKAVLIEGAERMTPQAQNCLLKTLEDPPPNTVFFLTTTSLSAILPTVRSRTRHIALAQLSEEGMNARLEALGVGKEHIAFLCAAAQGCVGRALEIAGDSAYLEKRTQVLDALCAIRTPADVLRASAAVGQEKEHARAALETIECALRDALCAKLTGQQPHAGVYPSGWNQLLKRSDAGRLSVLLEQALEAKKMLASNVPFQAILERLFMRIAEE